MKKGSIIALCMFSAFFVMSMTVNRISNFVKPISLLTPKPLTLVPAVEVKSTSFKILYKTQMDFLTAIGHRESSGRYDIVNQFGYMGKYQFGKKTLKWIGFDVTQEEFLNNPSLQEQAMLALMKKNKKSLKRHIEKYDGKIVHNVFITESGLIAAAHLGGVGSVRKFLRNGKEFKDGFGTSIVDYIEKFNGYKLVY